MILFTQDEKRLVCAPFLDLSGKRADAASGAEAVIVPQFDDAVADGGSALSLRRERDALAACGCDRLPERP